MNRPGFAEHIRIDRYPISSPLCMGFWVGFFVYGTVALCPPDIEHSFPLAAAVATSTHVYIQWTLAFFLGGLVGLCVVLAAQIFEAEQDREDQAKDSALDPLEPDPNDPIPHTPKYAKEPEKYSLVEVPRSCRLYNLFVQFNE